MAAKATHDNTMDEDAQSTVPAPEAGAAEDGRQWYVIHTYSGYENKVKKNLEHRIPALDMGDKIFRVVVPTEEEIEIKNGQRHNVQRKVYPGYVLIEMIMSDEAWYLVRNTPGVTGFVGMGNKPTALDPEEAAHDPAARWRPKRRRSRSPSPPARRSRSWTARSADFEGRVDNVNHEKGKVRVLVSIFGRETPVELDFLQIERLVS